MDYEIIVVGGGHAGLEASVAAAKMGAKTLLITLNIKKISNMPCNPSIGGSAKGIVVREIDALGGQMGIGADHTYLQMKMLNTGKGPGVQCLRSQADKISYPSYMQSIALSTKNLEVMEGCVSAVLHDDNHVFGIRLDTGMEINSQAVILTTGTYMEAQVLVGHTSRSAGPDGEKPSLGLSPYLRKMGIELIRLKTGTPPRLKKSTIDFSKMVPQFGTPGPLAFSYQTKTFRPIETQIPCHLIYTQTETHQVIRDNLKQSSLFSGLITGVGPRYCPSIEDKIVRFSEKEHHQLFVEPESEFTDSMYLQGFSTSMPHDVQEKMVRTLPGLEHVEFLKYAYAIEYDAFNPMQFFATLEMKKWPGLFGAGQILGTSGYEEAAGLGLMAGINATLKIRGQKPLILGRDEAYIGVMIDDLVTKGILDPYRLMSSRAEYRLLLRHDNADMRLTPYGYKLGLINEQSYKEYLSRKMQIENIIEKLKSTHLSGKPEVVEYMKKLGDLQFKGGITALELLRRPDVEFHHVQDLVPSLNNIEIDDIGILQLEVMVKYEGYIAKQKQEAERHHKLDSLVLPPNLDYAHMDGLALEARQKLNRVMPLTLGQASRVSGVNPSDIAVLLLYLKKGNKNELDHI